MESEESFENYPETLGERRADASDKASVWSPRDILVRLLRRIDAGELNPEHLIVIMGHMEEDGSGRTGYIQAGTMNPFAQIGMLQKTINSLCSVG